MNRMLWVCPFSRTEHYDTFILRHKKDGESKSDYLPQGWTLFKRLFVVDPN